MEKFGNNFLFYFIMSVATIIFFMFIIFILKKNTKEKDFRQENSIFYIHKIQILLV